jgi:SRSO17 transposase
MIGREGRRLRAGEDRFAAYRDAIVSALGHASRDQPARACCTGLLRPGERKNVEPMAARLDPERVQARRQSRHHLVAQTAWDDAAVLGAVRWAVIPAIERRGRLAY